jgi:hypothetical protein
VPEPNYLLRNARERTVSPYGSGQPLTRQELAELVNQAVYQASERVTTMDGLYIGKLERGVVRWPQDDYRTALRTVLRADTDRDLGFHPRRPSAPAATTDLVPPGAHPRASTGLPAGTGQKPARQARTLRHSKEQPADAGLEQLWTPGGLAVAFSLVEKVMPLTGTPLERRHFLALSGAALTAAAYEWLVADPVRLAASLAGRSADSALIADLNDGVDLLRRLDDKLGGKAIHSMVTEQLRLVVRVLRHSRYTEEDGRSLYAVAAELARLAGWTSYDAGDHGTAERYWLIGLRAAHEADAPAIGANILRCMAEQAYTTADPKTAVDLLRSARVGGRGRLTATESAMVAGILAIAHGRANDPRAAFIAADQAQQYIAESRPDEDPPYLYWAGPHIVELSAGSALLAADQAKAAIPHLRASVAGTPADNPQDLLQHQLILARAHAKAGDPDEAVSQIHDALDASPATSHRMVTGYLTEACQEIRAAGHPGAQDIRDHLKSVHVYADI